MIEPRYRAKFLLVNRKQKHAAAKEVRMYDRLFLETEKEFFDLLFDEDFPGYKILHRWLTMLHKRWQSKMRSDRFVTYLEPNENYLDYLKPVENFELTPFEERLIKLYRRLRG